VSPHSLAQFKAAGLYKEAPRSSVDVGELGGGKIIKLPDDLKAKLARVSVEPENPSGRDYALLCEMTKHIKRDNNLYATFDASARGADARNRKGSHYDDYMARTIKAVRARKATEVESVTIVDKKKPDEDKTYHPSDLGNSERLRDLFGDQLRYCAEQKMWYCWSGKRWAKNDITGAPMQMAKRVVKRLYIQAAAESDDDRRTQMAKWAFKSETRQRLDSMIALCRDLNPTHPSVGFPQCRLLEHG
jgi:hypothetical protein